MMGPGGLFVRVMHDGGVRSGYFHLNSFRVEAGQTVRAGEIIGTVGRTRHQGLGQPPALRGPQGRRAEGSGAFPVRVRAAARRHRHVRDREGREEAAAGARRAGPPAGAGSGAEPFELELRVGRRSVVALARMLLLPLIAGGCGMSALIENEAGRRVEARILGGSPGSVYLAGDNHERFTMRRDEIADVDFPGNVMMLGGAALTGVRRLPSVRSATRPAAALGQAGNCLGAVMPAVAGLLAFAWGLYSYYRSTHAFEDRSRPEPDPPMPPRPPKAPRAVAAGIAQARSVRRPRAVGLERLKRRTGFRRQKRQP